MQVEEKYRYKVTIGEEISVRVRAFETLDLSKISIDGSIPIASFESIQFKIEHSVHVATLVFEFLPDAPDYAKYDVQVEGAQGTLDLFSIRKSSRPVITELAFHGDTGPK